MHMICWCLLSSDLSLCRAVPCGYSTIDTPRPSHDGSGSDVNHGGITVIHRNVFSSRAISTPLQPTSFEHLICLLSAVDYKLILVTVYRPYTLIIMDVFFEELTTMFEIISAYQTMTVISGDFNIHVEDSDYDTARCFHDLLDVFGLVQHITGQTHRLGHTLDLIITLPACAPYNIIVDAPMLSDHSLVTCNFALSRPSSPPQQTRLMRRVSSIDGAAFARAVSETTICTNLEQLADCSVADLCSRYFNDLHYVLDCAAPCITVTTAQRPASPWFDGECRTCRCRTRALGRH